MKILSKVSKVLLLLLSITIIIFFMHLILSGMGILFIIGIVLFLLIILMLSSDRSCVYYVANADVKKIVSMISKLVSIGTTYFRIEFSGDVSIEDIEDINTTLKDKGFNLDIEFYNNNNDAHGITHGLIINVIED